MSYNSSRIITDRSLRLLRRNYNKLLATEKTNVTRVQKLLEPLLSECKCQHFLDKKHNLVKVYSNNHEFLLKIISLKSLKGVYISSPWISDATLLDILSNRYYTHNIDLKLRTMQPDQRVYRSNRLIEMFFNENDLSKVVEYKQIIKPSNIFHVKSYLFDFGTQGKLSVTGSMNCSKNSRKNEEELTYIFSSKLFESDYKQYFLQ